MAIINNLLYSIIYSIFSCVHVGIVIKKLAEKEQQRIERLSRKVNALAEK